MPNGATARDLRKHPALVKKSNKANSAAAGAYQLTLSDVREAKKVLRLPDFEPEVQDQVALFLIDRTGALGLADMGHMNSVLLSRMSSRWKSLASRKSFGDYQRFYDSDLEQLRAMRPTALDAPSLPFPSSSSPIHATSTPSPVPRSTGSFGVESLDQLVLSGVLTPGERARIGGGSALSPIEALAKQQACHSGALSGPECRSSLSVRWRGAQLALPSFETLQPSLSPPAKALLNKIRSSPQAEWRRHGACLYDWAGWRLNSNGVRTTAVDCGGTAMRWTIGVDCNQLKVNIFRPDTGWQGWKKPSGPDSKTRHGEDEMVASLCANITDTSGRSGG